MKVLILFGHPAFQKSKLNKALIQGIQDLEGLTIHDLYEAYPDMDIDIDYEQQLLVDHDCIIFHHPLYWYSAPAIFKEWMDLVLEHGFAFGSTGTALKGKLFFSAITTGAPENSYCSEGAVHYTIKELLAPIFQSARVCNMITLPPFVAYGSFYLDKAQMQEKAQEYRTLLKSLLNDTIDTTEVSNLACLNHLVKEK